MSTFLGIDPGHEGAAVLLEDDGYSVRAAWAWERKSRKVEPYDFRQLDHTRPGVVWSCKLGSLHDCGLRIAALLIRSCDLVHEQPAPVGVVEGLSVHRKAGPSTAIALGRAEGYLTGPLLELGLEWLTGPLASEWRPIVLGHAGIGASSSSDDSEDAAAALWRQLGQADVLGELLEDGHVAEAACLARWAWLQHRPAQQALLSARGRR